MDGVGEPRGITMNEYSWGIAVGILVIAASVGRGFAALLRAHAARVDRLDRPGEPLAGFALEDVQRRLGEVEERLDFAERLLAAQRDSTRLPSPQETSPK